MNLYTLAAWHMNVTAEPVLPLPEGQRPLLLEGISNHPDIASHVLSAGAYGLLMLPSISH